MPALKIFAATIDDKGGAVIVFSTLDETHNVGCSIPAGLEASSVIARVRDSLDVLAKAMA